jgi:hypothetical protein
VGGGAAAVCRCSNERDDSATNVNVGNLHEGLREGQSIGARNKCGNKIRGVRDISRPLKRCPTGTPLFSAG